MYDCNNYYHVNPKSHQGDLSGRYTPNFVNFPFFLKPLIWADTLSRRIRKKPAHLLGDHLLKIFDSTGPLDERWGTQTEINILRETVRLFSRSLDENPYISPIGRVLLKIIYGGHLKNRAQTIAFYEKNRQFIEKNGKFKAPLILTGFPRTGSTLLHRLLSQDPNCRSPFPYELEKTTPPLRTGQNPMNDPRIKKNVTMMWAMSKLVPGFLEKLSQSHVWAANQNAESFTYIQFHHCLSFLNCMTAGLRFTTALNDTRVGPGLLKYERNLFKMLDAYCPAKIHWVNKAPGYAPYFGHLFDTYPDAKVLVMHRNPSKSVASICRLLESWHVPFDMDGSFDKLTFGRLLQKALGVFWNTPMEWRDKHPQKESQIADIFYRDLKNDPIGMVRTLYEKFAMVYTPKFEDSMKIYLENNRQGKHGRHKYTNKEYGVDLNQLFNENTAYFKKYGYEPEPRHA